MDKSNSNKYEDLKKVFNTFNIEGYTKVNKTGVQDIINSQLLPISKIKGVNPYIYKFKNALLNIFALNNRRVEINTLLQLHMMVLANTSDQVKLVLFRLPTPKDKTFNARLVGGLLQKSKNPQYLAAKMARSETLIAFYNGLPIEIQRNFLQAVMDLRPNQTIAEYLNLIKCKYEINASYNLNRYYFEQLAGSTSPYLLENDRVGDVIELLDSDKRYIIYIDDKCTVRLYRDDTFKLEVNLNIPEDTPTEELGGLLSNVNIMRVVEYDIILDTLTANCLLAYFLEDDKDTYNEGVNFLVNILNTYPTTKEV